MARHRGLSRSLYAALDRRVAVIGAAVGADDDRLVDRAALAGRDVDRAVERLSRLEEHEIPRLELLLVHAIDRPPRGGGGLTGMPIVAAGGDVVG